MTEALFEIRAIKKEVPIWVLSKKPAIIPRFKKNFKSRAIREFVRAETRFQKTSAIKHPHQKKQVLFTT
ncbi:MAG: hypothetical protein HDT44_03885 [Ruminococcaceae bacterium]|nr:hypothetical protein [Oscillospiraceae bacterium]